MAERTWRRGWVMKCELLGIAWHGSGIGRSDHGGGGRVRMTGPYLNQLGPPQSHWAADILSALHCSSSSSSSSSSLFQFHIQ